VAVEIPAPATETPRFDGEFRVDHRPVAAAAPRDLVTLPKSVGDTLVDGANRYARWSLDAGDGAQSDFTRLIHVHLRFNPKS
jgi:hypothetical protein